MLIVESAKIYEVDRDCWEICHYDSHRSLTRAVNAGDIPAGPSKMKQEHVQGDFYCFPDGREIVICLSKQVKEALGIPLTIEISRQEVIKKLEICRVEKQVLETKNFVLINALDAAVKKIKPKSFLGRLEYLFTGKL